MSDSKHKIDIYRGEDPLDLPAYSIVECSRFLRVPTATVRAWVLGRNYQAERRDKFRRPLIAIADSKTPALSFRNAVELHVLAAMRRKYKIEMGAVRRALFYLSKQLGVSHPLADQQMLTDGKDLFIEQLEKLGKIVNISRDGQLEMRPLIDIYLSGIDRDPEGLPFRFFPFTRTSIESSPKLIALNPRVQFGRPCIVGTGITTSIIVERYRAGESIEALASDYGQTSASIEEAIRFEFIATAA